MQVFGAFIFAFIFDYCNGQMRTYNCVLQSLCKDSVIDPRVGEVQPNILYPSQCPSGTVQCNSVVCGTPTVSPSTTYGYAIQNSLPWQAYLQDDSRNKYVGGGVLIDQYHVLTAAHKISNLTGASVSVLMGVYNPATISQSPIQRSRVLRAYIHSAYNVTYLKNDVAILRLASPMNLTASTMTMCLPAAGTSFVTNPAKRCLVAGYGQTGFTIYDAATTLRQTYVPIVSSDTCISSYLNIIQQNTYSYLDTASGNEICAGGVANEDSCTQDGGSPLICQNTNAASYSLAGLVLWGKNCGQAGRYGVYLNVPNYLNWITSTIQCSNTGATTCANTSVMSF